MIKSVKIIFKKGSQVFSTIKEASFTFEINSGKTAFSLEFTEDVDLSEVYLEFVLEKKVTSCRSSSYEWVNPSASPWVANTHSPKMIKCEDGHIIVGCTTFGCWELEKESQVLRWYLFHPGLTPLMTYDHEDRKHFLLEQRIGAGTKISDAVLWTKGTVEEWARTPLGFLPIVCFTDHSDFDTLENLKVQRELFKNLGIRVTKGFFLFDYTHKATTASFEEKSSREELIQWEKDGHELAYHALSQSYRGQHSESEFQNFSSPKELNPVTTYIDHGFHPYNFTKQALGKWENWYSHMDIKGIKLIWNYLDSGEGNIFAVNQLNPESFTIRNILKSSKVEGQLGIKRSRYSVFRNLVTFGVPEEIFWASKYFKESMVGFRRKPSLQLGKKVLGKGGFFMKTIFSSGVFKNFTSGLDQIFHQSRFAPLFFKASNQLHTNICVFQTLFVRDFEVVFSEQALEKLLEEKGAFIAHTYFSYANPGHEGRLFEDSSWQVRPQTKEAFDRLSQLIKNQSIWNPTISEMKAFFDKIDLLEYHLEGDSLVIRNFPGITRQVQ